MKELIPKDTPKNGQWVYVIEKENNHVKIGRTKNLESRIKTLESQGGFKVSRIAVYGPYNNSHSIETKAHRMFQAQRLVGEWFNVDFQEVSISVSKIADEVGLNYKESSSETHDFMDIIDHFWPMPPTIKVNDSLPVDSSFRVIIDENGTTWIEHDDYGLLSPALFNALMIINTDKPKEGLGNGN